MSQVLGLCVGIGSLQDVDRSAQCRPRALCVGRLETVARFFTWRQADEDAVEVRVLQVEIQSQGMEVEHRPRPHYSSPARLTPTWAPHPGNQVWAGGRALRCACGALRAGPP